MLKIKWNNWRFYYRILFGLLILGMLFYTLFNGLINGITVPDDEKENAKNWEWFTQDKGDYTLNFFTFFTTQTNILVGSWLFFSALLENNEKMKVKKLWNYHVVLGITIYISITGIIFNTLLLPTVIKNTSVIFWLTTGTAHMLCPIVMIVYFILMPKNNRKILPMKQFIRHKLGFYYIYPICWVVIMLIRGEFRYQAGKAYAYQYFFLNTHKTTFGMSGAIWLVIATIFILSIIFVLSYLYNWLSLKQSKNY